MAPIGLTEWLLVCLAAAGLLRVWLISPLFATVRARLEESRGWWQPRLLCEVCLSYQSTAVCLVALACVSGRTPASATDAVWLVLLWWAGSSLVYWLWLAETLLRQRQ